MVRWIPANVQAFIVLIVVIMRVKLHVQAFNIVLIAVIMRVKAFWLKARLARIC